MSLPLYLLSVLMIRRRLNGFIRLCGYNSTTSYRSLCIEPSVVLLRRRLYCREYGAVRMHGGLLKQMAFHSMTERALLLYSTNKQWINEQRAAYLSSSHTSWWSDESDVTILFICYFTQRSSSIISDVALEYKWQLISAIPPNKRTLLNSKFIDELWCHGTGNNFSNTISVWNTSPNMFVNEWSVSMTETSRPSSFDNEVTVLPSSPQATI